MKRNILITFSLLMILNVLVITSVVVYLIYQKNQKDIDTFRAREMEKLKDHLTDLIASPYDLILKYYRETQDDSVMLAMIKKEFPLDQDNDDVVLLTRYRSKMKKTHINRAIEIIDKIRYDGGKGYFWITDDQLPYPKMVNHPIRHQENGQIMNQDKYNTEKYDQKNLYQAQSELCQLNGEGYVEYQIYKPGSKEFENKISYSRLFQPLNWIISTGIYTDQIEEAVAQETLKISQQVRTVIFTVIILSSLMLLLFIGLAERYSHGLVKAIHMVKDRLKQLSQGEKVAKVEIKRKDEIKEMTDSLNSLVDGINVYTQFAHEVGEGNLDITFEPLSEHDILGSALLSMRENLKASSKEEKERKWTAESMAKFGEILRTHNTDVKNLGDHVLKFLSEHIQINLGAIYVILENQEELEEEERLLQMISCYAFNRKKFLNVSFKLGDGLIGESYLHRQSITLVDAPKDYLNIKSGLGDSPPQNILIVPLLNNDVCYGVMELASIRQLEPFEVAFVESLSQSLASTINAVRVNEQTRILLQNSQKMTEELKAQEEELRQNQEELQTTQEEMNRRYTILQEDYKVLLEEKEKLQEQIPETEEANPKGINEGDLSKN